MTQVKDLEILSKYLSDDELKGIAKQAAYDLFKSSISQEENKYAKDNIAYYITQGAMMAMTESIEPIKAELQEGFNDRIKRAIKDLSLYSLIGNKQYGLDPIITAAIKSHEGGIKIKIDEIIGRIINNDADCDSLYSKAQDSIGDVFAELLTELLRTKYEKK